MYLHTKECQDSYGPYSIDCDCPYTENPLPCVVCRSPLTPVWRGIIYGPGEYVQPARANTFDSGGTYGSEYFDPCDGSHLIVNICDECTERAVADGRIVVAPSPAK